MTRWKVVTLNKGGSGEVIAVCTDKGDNEIHLATVNDQHTAAQIVRDHNRAEAFEAMRDLIDALELRLIDMQGRIDNCEEDTLSYLSGHIQTALAEIQGIRPSKQLKET